MEIHTLDLYYARLMPFVLNLLFLHCAVICFMAWIPHTVLRIYTAVNPDKNFPSFALGLAHVILLLEGTFFAVAFSQV